MDQFGFALKVHLTLQVLDVRPDWNRPALDATELVQQALRAYPMARGFDAAAAPGREELLLQPLHRQAEILSGFVEAFLEQHLGACRALRWRAERTFEDLQAVPPFPETAREVLTEALLGPSGFPGATIEGLFLLEEHRLHRIPDSRHFYRPALSSDLGPWPELIDASRLAIPRSDLGDRFDLIFTTEAPWVSRHCELMRWHCLELRSLLDTAFRRLARMP